jgi:hypothetical protein
MAIGWMTVLKLVPWDEVITNAPKVVEGARKLWRTVAGSPATVEPPQPTVTTESAAVPAEPEWATRSELQALAATVSALHDQMAESSALIGTLAEQNAQLIRQIESNRTRLGWLMAVVGTLAVVLGYLLLRA